MKKCLSARPMIVASELLMAFIVIALSIVLCTSLTAYAGSSTSANETNRENIGIGDIISFEEGCTITGADGTQTQTSPGEKIWLIDVDDKFEHFRVYVPKMPLSAYYIDSQVLAGAELISHDGMIIGDINSDRKVNAIDLTLLKRALMYGWSDIVAIHLSDMNADGKSNIADAVSLTRWLMGDSIRPAAPVITTTTITSNTTTTTTSTSTSKTTTNTTSTTTITYVTTSATSNPGEIINKAIPTIPDTSIPRYTESLKETKQGVFLFERAGQTYACTLLTYSDSNYTTGDLIFNQNLIKGLHFWKYNGSMKPASIDDALPNSKNLYVTAKDYTNVSTGITKLPYDLKEYKKLIFSDLAGISGIIAGKFLCYDIDVQTYDYNLNGCIDEGDLAIALKYFTSNPKNFFWKLNTEAFNRYFDNIVDLGHTNAVMLRTDETTPVEYAFCIPTGDLSNDFEGLTLCKVVQILPGSYLPQMAEYKEDSLVSEENAVFIAWVPSLVSSTPKRRWAKIDPAITEDWWFRAGYYVYLLDDTGHYRMDWIK
ncbi:MAG: hypothetical protein IKE91_08640 [Clostridia bacterium]|nr:hypothetical protein [Clostridia bacterium]